MKRVKTKHKGSGQKKLVRQITNDAIGYMLPILYISLKDELHLSVEEVRKVKIRIDHYSDYLTQGSHIPFRKVMSWLGPILSQIVLNLPVTEVS